MENIGSKFELGQVVQTRTIATEIENNKQFEKEVYTAFEKYIQCDWGDTHAEDKPLNDRAVAENNDRIVAKYKTSLGDIFIITEYDRSYTTIMFANEY